MGVNIKMITESFELIKPNADKVADKFYETLFKDFPQAKPLFKGVNLEKQKIALINSLVFSVSHLKKLDELEKYLKGLGARHVDYGAADEHYDWVGQSLLKTFKHFLKQKWTKRLSKEWESLYSVMADIMKEGAEERRQMGNAKTKKMEGEGAIPLLNFDLPDSLVMALETYADELINAKIEKEFRSILERRLRERTSGEVFPTFGDKKKAS